MARIRSINPAATLEEDVATMTAFARLAWAYLPCHADRAGRLKDNPFRLKLEILPTDAVDMDAILSELAGRRHIIRYEGQDGRKYIQIRNFHRYQNPHKNESASQIPAPSCEIETDLIASRLDRDRKHPGEYGTSPAIPDPIPGSSLSLLEASDPIPPERAIPVLPSTGSKTWKASNWLRTFGPLWCEKYAQVFYGQASDGKASGRLDDLLDRMPAEARATAQAEAKERILEYLTDGSPGPVGAKHSFAFFVGVFGGLGARAGPVRPRRTNARIETLTDWEPEHARAGQIEIQGGNAGAGRGIQPGPVGRAPDGLLAGAGRRDGG